MDDFKVKAICNMTDQRGNVRLVKDNEYTLLHEFEDAYTIVDETKCEVCLGKRNFYEVVVD